MAKKKKQKSKIRTEFRKRHEVRTRTGDFTRQFRQLDGEEEDTEHSERISGKGDLVKKRTIIGHQAEVEEAGLSVELEIDESNCRLGRVLSVHGLNTNVRTDDGERLKCAVRGILKSLSTDQRNVVVAGDRVLISTTSPGEGVIERVEPRKSMICRTSREKQHVLVANVDQLLIVGSAAEPTLKPNLIDRFLLTAEKNRLQPIICINKVDLVDIADLQPLVGVYAQMGYQVVLLSCETGFGIEYIKRCVIGKDSVVVGQSGVGKSSLLNTIDPTLNLTVNQVSAENQKGKHTTSAARFIPIQQGGHIVDTPGIRQFQLWDVIPAEVEGFLRDLRPYINLCRFPDCTHTHEEQCAVKDAVADGRLDARRYESYCHIFAGDAA